MAYTLEQLSTLEEAIASGARIVRYGDKEITYQTYASMVAARKEMQAELGITSVGNKKFYARHNKGFDGA